MKIQPGDSFDVFVFGRGQVRKGRLYKGTAIWNGSTQLMPYSRDPVLGGFTVNTDRLELDSVKFQGRTVHGYRR